MKASKVEKIIVGSETAAETGKADRWLVRPVSAIRVWIPAVIFWLLLIPLTQNPRHSGNVWSRYMTIESIAERGTLSVDRSPLRKISGSPDLLKVGPHLYSDKPPLLSSLAAVVYEPLYLAGWSFAGSVNQFVVVNWILVSLIVGGSSALALVGLRQLLQAVPVRPFFADVLTLAFGLGSLLLTYGVTFNNHSVAAGLATLALAGVVLEESTTRVNRSRFFAGFFAALAAMIDLPAGGAICGLLAVWLTIRSRNIPWAYLAGCVAPIVAHAIFQTLATGSPLPAEMTHELFEYEGSYWATEAGKWREVGPRWQFGLEFLFGPQGWLTVTPVLVIGLIGLASVLIRKDDPLRPAAGVVTTAIAMAIVYFTWGVRRTDFAGLSFGTRHMLALSPACFWFAIVYAARLRSKLVWLVLMSLMILGGVYAYAGMVDPWSRIERRDDSGLAYVKRLTLYPWSSYRR